jgi:hypothetical protein
MIAICEQWRQQKERRRVRQEQLQCKQAARAAHARRAAAACCCACEAPRAAGAHHDSPLERERLGADGGAERVGHIVGPGACKGNSAFAASARSLRQRCARRACGGTVGALQANILWRPFAHGASRWLPARARRRIRAALPPGPVHAPKPKRNAAKEPICGRRRAVRTGLEQQASSRQRGSNERAPPGSTGTRQAPGSAPCHPWRPQQRQLRAGRRGGGGRRGNGAGKM